MRKIAYFGSCGSDYGGVNFAPIYLSMEFDKKVHGNVGNSLEGIKEDVKEFGEIDKNKSLVVGGDHVSCLCALQNNPADGLVWLDAHADYNTVETSNTGNYHGMVLSMITDGYDWINNNISEDQVVLNGVRSVDPKEKTRLESSEMNVVSRIQKEHVSTMENIHLSIDTDYLDPKYAPGVNVPEKRGLTVPDVTRVVKLLEEKLVSVDITEYNPWKDENWKTRDNLRKIINSINFS